MKTPEQIAQENDVAMTGRWSVYDGVRLVIKEGRSIRHYLRCVVKEAKEARGWFHRGAVAEARAQAKAMGIRL